MAKTEEQIKKEMAANSAAWHTADAETRKQLEAANQSLGKQLGASFDSVSGTWSDSSGSALYDTPSANNTTTTTNKNTKPSNFTGSANNVVVNTLDQETIRDLMNANSQAWFDAPSGDENTPGTKEWLHKQNVDYASQLGSGVTFDPATGYWSGSADTPIKLQQLPSYDSQYSSQIDALLNAILNREEFSYDHTTDPSYLAYEQQYKRLGDRAREDTLGDIASLNGGYASSWAASAASQAQNDYNQQLSNIIPTLYDAAYNRYMDDYNKDVTNLGLVMGVDDTYYNRYRDTVADSQWQQQFDKSNEQWDKEYELSKEQFNWNKIVDDFNMKAQEQTTQFNQMMDRWSMTGVADNEVASYFGVPVGATTESYYFNKASLALDQAKFNQSQKEYDQQNAQVDAEKTLYMNSIIRDANNSIDPNADDSFEAADKLMAIVGGYIEKGANIGAAEYYEIGSRLGLPSSTLEAAFAGYLAESGGNEIQYEVYEREMLKHEGFNSAEEWYSHYYADIPTTIREQLRKNVLEDEYR